MRDCVLLVVKTILNFPDLEIFWTTVLFKYLVECSYGSGFSFAGSLLSLQPETHRGMLHFFLPKYIIPFLSNWVLLFCAILLLRWELWMFVIQWLTGEVWLAIWIPPRIDVKKWPRTFEWYIMKNYRKWMKEDDRVFYYNKVTELPYSSPPFIWSVSLLSVLEWVDYLVNSAQRFSRYKCMFRRISYRQLIQVVFLMICENILWRISLFTDMLKFAL